MRTIIAGGREVTEYAHIIRATQRCGWTPAVVISGHARGVDKLGELWAERNKIPCEIFPANWDLYGNKAGPIRNNQMAEVADALIAIWDGKSRGTKHMIDTATKKGLKVYVHLLNK